MSIDHAHLVSKFWKLFKPDDCLQYLKYVFENFISVGVFLESDPSQPVSWIFQSNFGFISGAHTLKEHRRKGYSRVAGLCLVEKILNANMIPLAAKDACNTAIFTLAKEIGFADPSIPLHLIHKSIK